MRPAPRFGPALILALLLTPLASPATAGVPSAGNSTVPACLTACPLGDMSFDVVVRDLANNPLAGSVVVLDFSSCPAAFICTVPGSPPDPYTVNLAARTLTLTADAAGLAHFPLRMGGGCAANTVRVFADGVQLGVRALASPDQDGDGLTSNLLTNDASLFFAKMGTSDPTADFECDGDVDLDDQNTFFQHASKSCFGFVDPARASSWGRLKSFYR